MAEERRSFLERISNLGVLASLVAAYGTFASYAVRYLYPARGAKKSWQYVAEIARFPVGDSRSYTAPNGAKVALARQHESGKVEDFVALSSTCPHLGCQVHWEANHNRFFCPCHNGAFDPSGKAIAGPPAEVGQSLPRYPLKIEGGLLYIEVPTEALAASGGLTRPGHDACLEPRSAPGCLAEKKRGLG